MDAVAVEHEALDGFLQPIDVNKGDDEDGVGAAGELQYS
jgi:hypothetical protein